MWGVWAMAGERGAETRLPADLPSSIAKQGPKHVLYQLQSFLPTTAAQVEEERMWRCGQSRQTGTEVSLLGCRLQFLPCVINSASFAPSVCIYFFSPCCFPPFSLAPCKCHIVSVAISLLSFPGLAARAAPAEESVVRMLASLCIHRRRTGSSSIARVITLGKKLADYSGPLSHCVLLCKILKERLVFANSSVSKSPRAVWVL